nr:F-box/LRR-repeat protein 14-like isoform X2 [Arachis hypogaea]XP_029151362.1 F-box/LRR-repeat protein 14-like isoform X2 [Arachis hypogaea]XP_029151363.1 F-box/LRR-repeat protein 14-like isoform X1 [Arachis hypogaea]
MAPQPPPPSSSSSSSRICRHQEPHLPDECWELIFKHISDPLDYESLSLVSRQLFSLTNSLRTDLSVLDPVRPLLPTLLRRFPNMTTIKITRYFTGDINALLSQIALFDLPSLRSLDLSHQPTFPSHGLQQFSQKFPTLKSLNCSFMPQDLGLIVECFPNLEEIDVSFPPYNCDEITDYSRVKAFASGLKKLRKVNVSGNRKFRNSHISTLCQNCHFLEELIVLESTSRHSEITQIANAIRQRSQLRSLSFSGWHDKISEFIDALVNLKGLTCLDLSYTPISDEVLCAVAEEGLPLRKLSLQYCRGYGYHGISRLLRKCNHLHYLDLESTEFLNDQRVGELSLLLGNLNFVKLNGNEKLTDLSLFAIMRNCPLITEIRMENTCLGKKKVEENFLFVNYSHVKFLYLANNLWLDDRSVTILASVCPNLEMMDLSDSRTYSKGVIEVLWRCCKIQRLDLAHLGYKEVPFKVNFEVPTLFVLNLSWSRISNEELSLISENCYNLKELKLEYCYRITASGVKQVVKNCKQLRMISLYSCQNISTDVIAWMLLAKSSLRKITFASDAGRRDLSLSHGCVVGWDLRGRRLGLRGCWLGLPGITNVTDSLPI